MLNKTIRISEEVHESLSSLASKNDTFNDVIKRLIEQNEEFTDEQAEYYNQEIERIENGIYEGVNEISLEELEKRVTQLEKEIKHEL
ncbi:antitoxin VapB family protein [uncultured Methanobrevibacter sp.]|uniref:antitoxin VapB family protein n=1 Tax=uncultured Methanobrevibacter sp. TaxID=253161 RepID=UPI0025E02E95|nr:antitoxin VapB family protein [uncultured Methanobrevibacter sp.]